MNLHTVLAVFKRNFRSQFGSPTAYVFIVLFIAATGYFAFVQDAFFNNNVSNLDLLNQVMPLLLLFFIPAITMGTWAEEKKQGTDELLFTLPIRDSEAVLGKYLAALGVYTVALFFTLGHALTLAYLGSPDWGQVLSSFAGYWLLGGALISVGMFASTLSNNVTVAFILGAFFCAILNYIGYLGSLVAPLSDTLAKLFNALATSYHFTRFGDGVIPMRDAVYFLAVIGFVLYLNVVIVGSRHTRFGGETLGAVGSLGRILQVVRIAAILLILVSANVVASRSPARLDLTEEQLQTLSPDSLRIIDSIPAERPVFIQAFISPEVPSEYLDQRTTLLQVLREFDSRGGDRIRVKIHSPERYSDEARIAEKRFSIQAQTVGTVEAGRIRQEDIFLGFAVTSGPLEEVLPFLGRGLSVEYELTRAIKTVSQIDKKVVGILDTMVKMNGGFDIETRSRENPWAITEDLRRQYEVRAVPLDAEVPKDIDVLLVPLPSSLTDDQMYYVHQYILSGSPALLLDDPFPVTNLSFAPKIREQQKQMAQNPMAGPSSTAEPDGDIRRFLNAMGLNFEKEQIVWDTYNPHQNLPENIPPEYVFLTGSGGAQQDGPTSSTGAFNKDEPMTSGLQEMVMLFPGYLKEYSGQGGDLKITPLLTTTNLSGTQTWDKYVQRDPFFGMLSMQTPPPSSYRQSPNRFMIAARIQGTMLSAYPEGKPSEGKSKDQEKEPANEEKKEDTEKPSEPKTSEKPIDVIAIADLDFISDTFYNLRAQGVEGFNFDNVTFISNCIDTLAGDESFVNLRKRRPKHRTLTTVELRINEFDKQRAEGLENAEAVALKETREAQDNFDKKVAEVQNRQDLDSRAKTVLIQNDRKIEQIRLNLRTATIEAEKEKKVNLARLDMQKKIRAVQNSVKVRSIILPPIPALLFGIIVFVRKGRRERQGIPSSRVRR